MDEDVTFTMDAKLLKEQIAVLGLTLKSRGVITDGIGAEAAPQHEAAAGKTGTAQTGRYTEGKDKSEKMDHWFAGFYPAENPQYTVVVLQDEQTQPATGCAAIFAEVCNAIYLLKSN